MKKLLEKIIYVCKLTLKGFQYICTLLSKGFYFYPKEFFILLKKLFKKKIFDRLINHFEKRQEEPEHFLLIVLYFVAVITLIKLLYVKPVDVIHNEVPNGNQVVDKNDNKDNSKDDKVDNNQSSENNNSNGNGNSNNHNNYVDSNPYRNFAKTKFEDINVKAVKTQNSDTVAWLSVDGTTINYPIVQTGDNDYYLEHSFDKSNKKSGWTFMDYRNNKDMSDTNTIFYGHNLLNMTAFGSIAKIFEKSWASNSNHSIVVVTEDKKYYYTVFSGYYTSPETYYLQTNFYSDSEKEEFLKTLSNRNILDIDNSISSSDKIITLSTCTDDNTGRKVIHAKLVTVLDN